MEEKAQEILVFSSSYDQGLAKALSSFGAYVFCGIGIYSA
jgi:hypothetical protein